MKPPEKKKSREDWTVEETIQYARSGEWPVSDEYAKARNKALEAAGLEPDMPVADKPVEDLSVSEHIARQGRKR